MKDIQKGYDEVSRVVLDGRPCPTYRIGEKPDAFADENPLYPGRPLRDGETCDQTGRSWQGILLIVRQVVYFAITRSDELVIDSVGTASDVMDKVVSADAEKIVRLRYPEASLLIDEARELGELPTLKVALGTSKSDKKNDPFHPGKTY